MQGDERGWKPVKAGPGGSGFPRGESAERSKGGKGGKGGNVRKHGNTETPKHGNNWQWNRQPGRRGKGCQGWKSLPVFACASPEAWALSFAQRNASLFLCGFPRGQERVCTFISRAPAGRNESLFYSARGRSEEGIFNFISRAPAGWNESLFICRNRLLGWTILYIHLTAKNKIKTMRNEKNKDS